MKVERTKVVSLSKTIQIEPGHDIFQLAKVMQKNSSHPNSGFTLKPTQKLVQKNKEGSWETIKVPFLSSHIIDTELTQIADIYEAYELLDHKISDLIKKPRPAFYTLTYGHVTDEASMQTVVPRKKDSFKDVAQHMQYLDIDSIIAPSYLRGRPLESLAWWLRNEILPEWLLDCSFIIQATGSHGCISKCGNHDIPRLRLLFWFEKKLTISEFKKVAQKINADMKARGVKHIGSNPLDLSIYSLGHMLFILPPVTTGDGLPFEHDRLMIFDGNYDEAKLPENYLDVSTSNIIPLNSNANYMPSPYSGLDIEALLDKIQSEGTHKPTLAIAGQFACKYPNKTERDTALDEFIPTLQSKFVEISQTEIEYNRRCKEEIGENGNILKKSADDYFAKYNRQPKIIPKQKNKILNPYTIDQFRREFPDNLKKTVRQLLEKGQNTNDAKAPVIEFKIPAGAGKSYAALKALVDPAILNNFRIFYSCQTHEQSEERCAEALALLPLEQHLDYEDMPLIRVWKGRRNHCLVTGHEVYKQARRLEEAGVSPISACKTCNRFSECSWIEQREDDANGLIFSQHANITTTLAKMQVGKKGAPDLIVIDESWWQVLLESEKKYQVNKLNIELTDEDNDLSSIAKNKKERLSHYRKLLCASLEGDNERVKVPAISEFAKIDFTQNIHIDNAINYETSHRNELINSIEDLQAKLAKKSTPANQNKLEKYLSEYKISSFVLNLYRAFLASIEINDRTNVIGVHLETNSGEKYVSCNIKKTIPDIFQQTPIITMNASANKKISEAVLGTQKSRLDFKDRSIHIPDTNYIAKQVADRPFGKSMFLNANNDNPSNHSNLKRLFRNIWLLAFKWRGARNHTCYSEDGRKIDVLVICQKAVAEILKNLGLPSNVEVRNFPVEGLNGFKDVPCLCVVGRRCPPTKVLEQQAEALNYDNTDFKGVIEADTFSYDLHKINMVDGNLCEISGERHPAPFCEDIRHSIADEGVIQAIHRARLFDRTQDNYCEIHVYGSTNIGIAVHEVMSWESTDISLFELSVANDLIFSSKKTSARAYGHIFGSATSSTFAKESQQAWKKAKDKLSSSVQVSINNNILGSRTNELNFRRIKFRLHEVNHKGHKRNLQHAYINVSRYDDAKVAIESLVNEKRSSGQAKLECIDLEWDDIKTPKKKRGRPRKTKKK